KDENMPITPLVERAAWRFHCDGAAMLGSLKTSGNSRASPAALRQKTSANGCTVSLARRTKIQVAEKPTAANRIHAAPASGRLAETVLFIERVKALAVNLFQHVPPDLHGGGHLFVLDGERLVGEDHAPDLLDHRKLGVHP